MLVGQSQARVKKHNRNDDYIAKDLIAAKALTVHSMLMLGQNQIAYDPKHVAFASFLSKDESTLKKPEFFQGKCDGGNSKS